MSKYEWYKYKDKEVVEKKANVRLKGVIKDTFSHTKITGAVCNIPIEGHLRNEIIREIVIGTFKKCGIKGNISNLKCHRLNRG